MRQPTWMGFIENGLTRNPLTLWTAPVLVHSRIWVHILGDPQCSAEDFFCFQAFRNATTTTATETQQQSVFGLSHLSKVLDVGSGHTLVPRLVVTDHLHSGKAQRVANLESLAHDDLCCLHLQQTLTLYHTNQNTQKVKI